MPTDPLTASRYPASSAAPNVPQDIQNAVFDLSDNTIPYFTSTTARNTAYTAWVAAGGVMREGLYCHVAGSGLMVYQNSTWRLPVGTMALLHGSGTQAIATNGSHKAIVLNSSQYATGLTTTTATGRITALFAGRYMVSGGVLYSSTGASSAGYRIASILKNGVVDDRTQNRADPDTANSVPIPTASYPFTLAIGDYVQLGTFHNAGVSQNIDLTGCFLQAHYIGPS